MKTNEQLQNEILSITDWRHPFELKSGKTVENNDKFDRTWLHDFQLFKREIILNIINNIIPKLTGKKTGDMSCIDIGCNDGFFSVEANRCGFEQNVGLELREESVQRANLMKDYYGIKNLEFRNQNIEEVSLAKESFDVTLFLGLLYHLTSPVEVLAKVSSITENTMIIMTFIVSDDTSSLRLIREDEKLNGSGAKNLITRPSEKAVVNMLDFAGFNEVARFFPYPFFDIEGSRNAGITRDLWAVYVANKGDKKRNLKTAVPEAGTYFDSSKREPQWVILKSHDNNINCLLKDTRFKSKLKRIILSWLQ